MDLKYIMSGNEESALVVFQFCKAKMHRWSPNTTQNHSHYLNVQSLIWKKL
jgi:hypothetical protein